MTLSGACALAAGIAFGAPSPSWSRCWWSGASPCRGFAQFSAAVSELARASSWDRPHLQTSLGFLLTCLTIYLLPWVAARVGWRWSMSLLALRAGVRGVGDADAARAS